MLNLQINAQQKFDKKEILINELYNEIEQVIINNKTQMIYQINNTLVKTYFIIGKIIIEKEQKGNIYAEYGKEILLKLSKKLATKYGT